MATTPRAGIINLNFKDVSQMAQNIADNDPWKLGIETAGKVLTDREKYILYQRALADVEGRDRPEDKTAGELISSGISKAGEKAGDAFSWLGEKAGKGIDKLRALMPSETIEKSYEQGEKTESPIFQGEMSKEDPFAESISRADGSSEPSMTKLQAPAESGINVSFPTTVVGKDKEIERPRREVGGKFDWTFPDKGYNTEFPTTVVGAPEDTKEPAPETDPETAPEATPETTQEPATETTPIAGSETAPESASPFGATEAKPQKIKAPRMTEMEAWSEMNRLDPERAKFDWDRIAPKGSGAAGTVQARLEHDSKIDQEIAAEAAALREDMLANGWTSKSPEFLDRYATIMDLVAQKFVKGGKNDLLTLIGLTDKEFSQDQATTKAELDAKKQDFAEKKEMTDIDQKAFEVTNSVMGDLLEKQYVKPAQLQAIAADLRDAVADPNNINEASIKKAVKAFIQSIDNSVVMSFEAQSFADQSKLGQIRDNINLLFKDNIYSPERLGDIWDNMVASLAAYNAIADNLITTAKDFYTQYGGKNVGVIDKWGSLIKANSSLGPKPDFSRVKTWWEEYKLGDKSSENPESVYAKDLNRAPKAWDKKTSSKDKAKSTVYDKNSSTEGF